MPRTVLMSRGPATYQWRTAPIQTLKPRPMDRDRMVNQLAVVTGVPEDMTNGELMRLMANSIWVPGRSEKLTRIRFEDLGPDKRGILSPQQPDVTQ